MTGVSAISRTDRVRPCGKQRTNVKEQIPKRPPLGLGKRPVPASAQPPCQAPRRRPRGPRASGSVPAAATGLSAGLLPARLAGLPGRRACRERGREVGRGDVRAGRNASGGGRSPGAAPGAPRRAAGAPQPRPGRSGGGVEVGLAGRGRVASP